MNTLKNNKDSGNENDDIIDETTGPTIPRRGRTPSIIVQSLGLNPNDGTASITESIELLGQDDDENEEGSSDGSNSTGLKQSKTNLDQLSSQRDDQAADSSPSSSKGSISSLQNSSSSPLRNLPASRPSPNMVANRRLSLNIGPTAPRRLSLTVEGLSSLTNINRRDSLANPSGNATGSLRNKVALKPGHSLMGWINLTNNVKDLSGTNGKLMEVTPEELAKHDKEDDCWVALKDNVYNVTKYLQYHPGGVEELMRGAGQDVTELFNEVHIWVNYESILAKCLVGPYKPG